MSKISALIAVPSLVLLGLCALAIYRHREKPVRWLVLRSWGFLCGIKLVVVIMMFMPENEVVRYLIFLGGMALMWPGQLLFQALHIPRAFDLPAMVIGTPIMDFVAVWLITRGITKRGWTNEPLAPNPKLGRHDEIL